MFPFDITLFVTTCSPEFSIKNHMDKLVIIFQKFNPSEYVIEAHPCSWSDESEKLTLKESDESTITPQKPLSYYANHPLL